ncbi:hypothetical protein [Chryseobacterium wanjuense]
MQGIEPKFHNSLTERMEYYRYLLQKSTDESGIESCDVIAKGSELCELYEDYLNNKRNFRKASKIIRNFMMTSVKC